MAFTMELQPQNSFGISPVVCIPRELSQETDGTNSGTGSWDTFAIFGLCFLIQEGASAIDQNGKIRSDFIENFLPFIAVSEPMSENVLNLLCLLREWKRGIEKHLK
ncbi:hypothetical protein ZHAS_00021931 [Anopheles sinensis]|uniref:Uncharacterized protein n=1 Tax=Anopheles sinensis TaxID=74873 RepID=A0A084WT86_ANOSI|nr:hypothetical protein ZHAS_00021931 [Anopheles sinensis]